MKKIRVLQFICPAGLYGAEMWILALAKYLDREKIKCDLAITLESETQNIEVFHRFKALGLDAYQVQMNGRFDLRCIKGLVKLIREQQIDIIHTHGYKSDILGLIAAKITGIKSLATPHGFENAKDFKLQMFIKLGCLALKYHNYVAPLSEELMEDMRRLKIKNEKIRLIKNGVDLDEIDNVRDLPAESLFNSSDKIIGYVGQVAHRKNIGDMIKAFDLLYTKHKNIGLIIVGDGPQREEMEALARSMASGKKIEFWGYRKDRLKILKGMDLFTMTSSLEGIPRCMMEAMGMGKPVAAFNIPGVDKLIIPEKTGLMAEFGNIKKLAEQWERLLFDLPFAKEIAMNGRQHILDNFSAKRMADEYVGLYEELLKIGHR